MNVVRKRVEQVRIKPVAIVSRNKISTKMSSRCTIELEVQNGGFHGGGRQGHDGGRIGKGARWEETIENRDGW